jgi:hypothetical protein
VESASAVNRATVESTSRATRKSASARKSAAAYKPTATHEPATAYKSTTVAPTAPATASPAIPRASTDKQSARKPARTVVAERRAGVRVISVVAIRACRLYTNSYANRDLRLRIGQRQHQNRDQSQIFHIPHGVPPCLRSVLQPRNPPDPGLLDLVSIRSAYVFELGSRKKVAVRHWLISATLPEFNHLQGQRGMRAPIGVMPGLVSVNRYCPGKVAKKPFYTARCS